MPENPIAVDVVVLPTVPIGVTIADTTIVVATTVNLGNTIAVDASEYASGPPGVGVPVGGTAGQYLVKNTTTDYDASWATAGGGPPSGAAGGDLLGSTYPNPVVKALGITRAKIAADAWLSPIPVGGDVGKVLTVAAGPTLTWGAGGGGSPTGAAGGDLLGSTYPNPVVAALAITNAKINDVAWTKLTGTASAIRGTPSSGGTAREIAKLSIWAGDDLIDLSIPTAKLAALAVTDGKINDVAWTKLTGTLTVPSGDLSGTFPGPTVAKLNGATVGTTTPLARGDILVANATPALSRLAKGATNAVLTSSATDAVWAAITQAMLPVAPSGLLTANINDVQVTDAKINDMAATKLTGTIAQARFPVSPSGLQTTNINDSQVTRVKCAADLWLAPVPTGADNGKVLSVINATPTLGWATPSPGITMQGNAVPTGTRPGTVFTLPATPTMMIASLNGLVLQKVGSPAANDEYSQSGTTMTTFYTVTAADKLVVWLWV